MIITIDMENDQHIEVLRKWASVSRTFDMARAACEIAATEGEHESDAERYGWCGHELLAIQQPLDNLHQMVRSEIWRHDAELKGQQPRQKRHRIKITSITWDKATRIRDLDQKFVDAISESYKILGQRQPILVREYPGGYSLLDGLVRVEAAKKNGWAEIDAIFANWDAKSDPIRNH